MIRPMSQAPIAPIAPIAPAAPRRRAAASPAHRSATGYQRRWTRRVGALALAGGLVLVPPCVQATDLNAASMAELAGVRGVGPKMAERIVKERLRGGPFESMEDLADRVRGIGWRKAQALRAAGLSAALVAAPRPGGAVGGHPPAMHGKAMGAWPAAMRPGRAAGQRHGATAQGRRNGDVNGGLSGQDSAQDTGKGSGQGSGPANGRLNGPVSKRLQGARGPRKP